MQVVAVQGVPWLAAHLLRDAVQRPMPSYHLLLRPQRAQRPQQRIVTLCLLPRVRGRVLAGEVAVRHDGHDAALAAVAAGQE